MEFQSFIFIIEERKSEISRKKDSNFETIDIIVFSLCKTCSNNLRFII